LQDWVSPIWARLAGGCHLNRDAVTTVIRSGLTVERVIPHARGFVLEIFARTSRRPSQESVVRRLGVLAAKPSTGQIGGQPRNGQSEYGRFSNLLHAEVRWFF
jgi:hypothetical protein